MSSAKVFKTLGASNWSDSDREKNDFYRTDSVAIKHLLDLIGDELPKHIWECACGDGALSTALEQAGYQVKSTDLVDRGFGVSDMDFLSCDDRFDGGAIITNPPFKHAEQFIRTAINKVGNGDYVCMFLRTLFLEGKARKKLFEQYPPKIVAVSSSRIMCAKPNCEGKSNAMSFSWFIWQKGHQGDTVVRWF
ncbi:MAG: hypothetical protein Q3971_03210 [Moraxella sp.]|nr:hypothetical protein [Moraxella sp.]